MHGDTGVLKSRFRRSILHRYAERYPKAQVKIAEGTGTEILTLLERGEVHLGNAASRLVGLKPTVLFESRNPHTLLALAEGGHGVAIVPSQLQCHRYALKILGLTCRGRPLREPLTILWDKRRPLPRFATEFREMLAQYMREVFPITRPTEPKSTAARRPRMMKRGSHR
jgi:DNA-binding transcriptional LysR family regulator